MPTVLSATELTADLLSVVRGLDYGSEPYQAELGTWLDTDAEFAMSRGTRVWAYATPAGEIVGYSSLGTSRWTYPDAKSKKETVVIIPAVALRREYWGEPKADDKRNRFASQIMSHLLTNAERWPGEPPAVGLYVHPANNAAIKLYHRFGFQLFHTSYFDKTSGVTYFGYVRPIARQSESATPG